MTGVLDAEAAFFGALLAADRTALDRLLAGDFVLVDVVAGQVVDRATLLDLVGSRQLRFLEVVRDPADVSVRRRSGLAVVVGRTRMAMRFGEDDVSAHSRYTHVYVDDGDGWRLLSAQGTLIAAPASAAA